ncbi:type 1 glutamine amidotransferase domain-containing protein [Rubrimonas cliftonensis]|nr:type 1 glutamine amidotransferase domain-containing protein [Rubrimonas cliftonensis]
MKILMVLTSHDKLGETGEKTGFWLEEFAAPYYVFKDAGAEVTLASPAGGQPPLDPKSDAEDAQTEHTRRFRDDADAQRALASTERLAGVDATTFDAVFYPGGHGPLWDLAASPDSIALIEAFLAADKPMGFVCHAPGVLRNVRAADGAPFVRGRRVSGFTNEEEAGVGLTDVVPFLIEDVFIEQGARYEKGPAWSEFVVEDGRLVTGQNPASSEAAARALLRKIDASALAA